MRRSATEKGWAVDEDSLFNWALDLTFFTVRKSLTEYGDLAEAKGQVRDRMYRYLRPQLWRLLSREQRPKPELEDKYPTPNREAVEEAVRPLHLREAQEDLLLRVMYKRDGEKLTQVLTSEQDRWNWAKLRQQLAVRLREANSE